jgi:uncharacterized membrane protein
MCTAAHRVANGAGNPAGPLVMSRRLVHLSQTYSTMLYTIAFVLIILWLLGMVSAYTMSGFIHVLLVIAVVMLLVRIVSGRGPAAA